MNSSLRFRYRVTLKATGERFYTRTRKAARWAAALWGGRVIRERWDGHRNARKLYFLKCWGPDPKRTWKDVYTVQGKLWVPKTLARLFAWRWELKSKRHIATFVRGDVYLDAGRKLRRPHSSEKVPF